MRARGPGPPLPACSPRRAQILVGSWSADLLTSTGHLVRCEVHPDLRPLVLPAKMLQNTLARGPPAHAIATFREVLPSATRGSSSAVVGDHNLLTEPGALSPSSPALAMLAEGLALPNPDFNLVTIDDLVPQDRRAELEEARR